MAKKYLVKVGLNYPTKTKKDKRAEPGDKVTDLPEKSIAELIDLGYIEEAGT
ncbi:hypothetical protein O7630_06715 [Micromonospora sp. WMMD718]|uniref:hypothetical protein n=1 Tax=unclassified Micromonospora TaxID=2617518 RepID=UPI000AA784E8|nr:MULTISPECIES: hypothetical protein [unclassified Micromonospora]MDG4750623.1 hypothetical protein [Micromonospora sp. WMMD718]